MKAEPDTRDDPTIDDRGHPDREHDAYVREKIVRGLAQSRDRSAMIPVERVLRDLSA